jgi:hypothetical protein
MLLCFLYMPDGWNFLSWCCSYHRLSSAIQYILAHSFHMSVVTVTASQPKFRAAGIKESTIFPSKNVRDNYSNAYLIYHRPEFSDITIFTSR